jgi:hypothetical protein
VNGATSDRGEADKAPKFGGAKGLGCYIVPDFDAPLEDLSESG